MSGEKKTVTMTINVDPAFKARLQSLAKANSGGSLSAEIVSRLEFSLKWASHCSVEAFDHALSAMADDDFAIVSISAKQWELIDKKEYRAAALAREIGSFIHIYPLQQRGERRRRMAGDGVNVLADMFQPMGAIELKQSLAVVAEQLIYETDLDIGEDQGEALKGLTDVESLDSAIEPFQVVGQLVSGWLSQHSDAQASGLDGIEGKRNTMRLIRSGELLTSASTWLADLILHRLHQFYGLEAVAALRGVALEDEEGVLSSQYSEAVAAQVSTIDKRMCEALGSFKLVGDSVTKLSNAVFSLKSLVASE